MLHDVMTIFWKESREYLTPRSRSRRETAALAFVLAIIFALVYHAGGLIIHTPQAFGMPTLLVLFLMLTIVADSFAGERERHTLETLLSSRLPDMSILIGKIATAVAIGWGLILVLTGLGITGALASDAGTFHSMPWTFLGLYLFYMLLAATMIGSTGVLISLRSATVRQAIQLQSIGLTLVIFTNLVIRRGLPAAWRASAMQLIASHSAQWLGIAAALLLVALNAILFAFARFQFQRSQLSLD